MSLGRSIIALLQVGLVLAAPASWGCDSIDGPPCTMESCPMAVAPEASCQAGETSTTEIGARVSVDSLWSFGNAAPVSLSCCVAPIDERLARVVESGLTGLVSPPPPGAALEVELEPPSLLLRPHFDPAAIQLYDLGRFTLHSSLLL